MTETTQWWRRWPYWVPRAATGWCLAYGALCTYWIFGDFRGFPFVHPDGEVFGGPAVGRTIAVVLLAGCLAGAAAAAASGGAPRSRVVTAGLVAGTAGAAIGSFGLAISAVGAVVVGAVEQPLAVASQLVAAVGAGLLFATTQVRLRRRRGACPRCGTHHPGTHHPGTHRPGTHQPGTHQPGTHRPGASTAPLRRPAPCAAPPRLRRTAYLAMLGLLPWAIVKLYWGFGGDALGMTDEEWRQSMAETERSGLTRFLEQFGIDPTVVAGLVGVILVLALTGRWAWWVPRWLLLVPAWVGGVSLSAYGFPLLLWGGLTLAGVVPEATDPGRFTATGLAWIIVFGGASFAGLGTALALGAWSFQRRSRPVCAIPAGSPDGPAADDDGGEEVFGVRDPGRQTVRGEELQRG